MYLVSFYKKIVMISRKTAFSIIEDNRYIQHSYQKLRLSPYLQRPYSVRFTKMETYGIKSDTKIEVIYPGDIRVEFGGELTPTQVKDEPKVKWDADPEKYYVLSMVDPDAPSRMLPIFREVNHWLVVNIKGGYISTGEVITEYRGSGPPKRTGLHRYVFLIYEQKEKQTFDIPKSSKTTRKHRLSFSIRKLAKRYNLGQAYAGTYFQARWDPYVSKKDEKP